MNLLFIPTWTHDPSLIPDPSGKFSIKQHTWKKRNETCLCLLLPTGLHVAAVHRAAWNASRPSSSFGSRGRRSQKLRGKYLPAWPALTHSLFFTLYFPYYYRPPSSLPRRVKAKRLSVANSVAAGLSRSSSRSPIPTIVKIRRCSSKPRRLAKWTGFFLVIRKNALLNQRRPEKIKTTHRTRAIKKAHACTRVHFFGETLINVWHTLFGGSVYS